MELTEKQKETLKRNNEESNFVTRDAAQEALFLLLSGYASYCARSRMIWL